MSKQYNHIGQRSVREAWRRQDALELAQEIAQERAGRQKFIQRVGPATAAQLERRAQNVEYELAKERKQADQRTIHEQRLARIRGRIVQDQAAERRIARLKQQGGPEAARQIDILRLGIQARKLRGDR